MGNIGWTGIIIIAILVVILFGKGKISSIMGARQQFRPRPPAFPREVDMYEVRHPPHLRGTRAASG